MELKQLANGWYEIKEYGRPTLLLKMTAEEAIKEATKRWANLDKPVTNPTSPTKPKKKRYDFELPKGREIKR